MVKICDYCKQEIPEPPKPVDFEEFERDEEYKFCYKINQNKGFEIETLIYSENFGKLFKSELIVFRYGIQRRPDRMPMWKENYLGIKTTDNEACEFLLNAGLNNEEFKVEVTLKTEKESKHLFTFNYCRVTERSINFNIKDFQEGKFTMTFNGNPFNFEEDDK